MYTDKQIIEALEVRVPHDAVCREAYDLIQRQRAEIAETILRLSDQWGGGIAFYHKMRQYATELISQQKTENTEENRI